MAGEGNLEAFLKDVRNILLDNSNQFVKIKDIQEELGLNFEFKYSAQWMCVICFPLTCLPNIEFQEYENMSLSAYSYKPDIEVNGSPQNIFASLVKEVVGHFKKIIRESDLREQDVILEEAESRLRRVRRDEWTTRDDY